MSDVNFEVKSYPEMWRGLGMDVERFEKMRCVLGDVYQKVFMFQEGRPKGMEYFDWIISEIHGGRIKEILDAKAKGAPVVGTFCVYVPEELVLAAGGVCLGLCGGSPGSIPDAEKTLPRNICPMVKSAFGFKAGKICPYFQAVDFVYGETTCDAKKKTWEQLSRLVPTHVMEIPHMKRERDRRLWIEEVHDFKAKMESVTGKKITAEDISKATVIMNNKRRALQRLNRIRHTNPSPISGKDVLLIQQIAFYDDPVRFAKMVNELCDELALRVVQGVGVMPKETPRIMVSGTPKALPNWKVHNIVETSGGIVVDDESCIGTRYYKDLMDETETDIDKQIAALTDRYMKIDCACFTPNDERVEQVIKEYEESGAQGVIHYCLQFCHTYNIEAIKIKEACDKRGIPFLAIESDYSPDDIGQIKTRVEALLEQIKG